MNTHRFVVGLGLGLALTFVLLGALSALADPVYAQTGDNAAGPDTPKEKVDIDWNRPPLPPAGPRIANASNGDFENGPDGSWVEYSALGWPLVVSSTTLSAVSVTPHSGNWAVWLGGSDDEVAYISQTLTVPASQSTLSFWKWIGSEDACEFDFGSVLVNNSEVFNLDLCDSANTYGWDRTTVDLSAYAGQSIQLQIRIETDDNLNSSLFVDDITFESISYTYLPIVVKNFCTEFPGYFDDFSDPSSGWRSGDEPEVTWGYVEEDEEYQVLLKNFDIDWFLETRELVLPANYRVEVDTRQESNSGNNGLVFGVGWSATGRFEGYMFLINPDDQTYWLNKRWTNGEWSFPLKNWTYSQAIHQDGSINHLRVDRVGTTIRLYINDTQVTTVTDGSFTGAGRDAGVVAYIYQAAPIDMRFDNFQASCAP